MHNICVPIPSTHFWATQRVRLKVRNSRFARDVMEHVCYQTQSVLPSVRLAAAVLMAWWSMTENASIQMNALSVLDVSAVQIYGFCTNKLATCAMVILHCP